MKKFIILFFMLLTPCFAMEDVYRFDSVHERQRFEELTTQLRCLVCQNQNIAESNAALANDLRNQIYQKIQAGESDPVIIQYLIERYGDYVLYKPPLNSSTLLLWIGPFLFLLMGVGVLFYYLYKNKEPSP